MSDRTLVISPSGLPERLNKPWTLVLRAHDLSGASYQTIAHLSDSLAQEVIEAGSVSWLYGEPDWTKRHQLMEMERAKILREEAAKIEAAVSAGHREEQP